MSRVAQLDSSALDQEIHSLFWSEFTQNISPGKNKEEWQLALETLVFYFGSKYAPIDQGTTTYGSQLSGVKFACKRRTLFIISILSKYLNSRISHLLFTTSATIRLIDAYRYLSHIYSALDLLNFAHFLFSTSSTCLKYLSPLHRILGVSSSTDTLNPINFYHETVYAGIEYQNRQLLWNAILELFNVTLLNNARWLNRKPQTQTILSGQDKRVLHCPRCSEFPTNPYKLSCCKTIYCYICVVKSLEIGQCDNCNSSNELQATPIY